MKRLVAGVALLALGACSGSGRLYDLDSGQVLRMSYGDMGIGHGPVTVTLPDGRKLTGEYSTVSSGGASYGSGLVTAGGKTGWATTQGFVVGPSTGAATVVGNGLVIDMVFNADPWTGGGTGLAQDNQGHHYRVMF